MRPAPLFALLSLALGACAPAATGGAPPASSSPAPAPVPPAASGPSVEPDQVLTEVPERWWLLDRSADRVLGISAERAYAELLASRAPARSVVVAIIDSGVDVEHEDLDDVLWVNEDEVAGNGVDDDANGYVDDVHGWNFIGGPDGAHVEHDTYELTRLVVVCRAGPGAAAALSFTAEDCRDLEGELRTERSETEQFLQQIRPMTAAMTRFEALLREHLGTEELTARAVAAIRPTGPEMLRAQQAYLQLAANGIDADILAEQEEYLEEKLQYGLNPDFDPRPIVGDDYSNPEERGYGNALVEGPDAEHGTHVAGIVAAERGNGIGVDGIASAARIMVLRAVPNGDERDKDVANAIRYAADNGAHIINMSFGKAYSPHKRVVDEAVRYAASRGVLIVHAAGNDASDVDAEPSFPTRYLTGGETPGNWIEVGASSWEGAASLAAPFSNYSAKTVDVFAPGVEILSTVPGDAYKPLQGTSMAAPVVSGLAALLMAYYPDLTAEQVKRVILESSTRFAEQMVVLPGSEGTRVRFGDLSSTGGLVNAFAALQMADRLSSR